MKVWIPTTLLIVAWWWLPQAQAQNKGRVQQPHQVIQQVKDELLEAIGGNREQLENDPDALHAVVNTVLRPRFDVQYASRLILARNWSQASAAQREQFTEALYGSLVRRYSKGLLEQDETTVRLTPPRLGYKEPEEDFVTVKTVVLLDDGTEVPVDYEMRYFERAWLAYDVKIEGRSYVAYYRDTIGEEISQKGLAQVIEDLNGT